MRSPVGNWFGLGWPATPMLVLLPGPERTSASLCTYRPSIPGRIYNNCLNALS
jgi:hypothetical protein